jgi:opacity protein-like surface antigen
MRIFTRALLAMAAVAGLVSTASAADLAYKVRAPVMATPAYNWSGFYGGLYGGMGSSGGGNYSLQGDPTAANGVEVGPAANGGQPIFSTAYNNLAGASIIPNQVSNALFFPTTSCFGLTNACAGGPFAATNITTPNTNPGFRTDSVLPSSQAAASQMAGLYGLEIGARQQFDHIVLGIGADITGFSHGGGTTNINSQGSFLNSNGFTGNSTVLGCIVGILANTCDTAQLLQTSGSVITTNSGASTLNMAIASNLNWIGTVRATAGYAVDRLLIYATGGLAYSNGGINVTGTYNDKVTSACSGVSNSYIANVNVTNGGSPGFSQVNYSCNGTAVNTASVNRVTTTTLNLTGNHGGGMLTGFAAGSGVAYAMTDHISLNIEGLYYNLGTARTTVTGSGTQTTTTNTTAASVGGGPTTTTTTGPVPLTSTPITVAKMIDGVMLKGGIQFKF